MGVASVLLIDDCLQQILNGSLPILEVFTNGRADLLTVVQTTCRGGDTAANLPCALI